MKNGREAIAKAIDWVEETIIALLFAGMTLVTFCQVFNRYVLDGSWVWALELVTYLFAWLVLFGASYGIKKNAHLGVDAFVKLFSSKAQRVLALVVVAAALLYALILGYGGWNYVSKLFLIGIESEDLPIPQWLPMVILPLGMALLALRLLQAGWLVYRGERSGLLADEARDSIKDIVEEGGDDMLGTAQRDRDSKDVAGSKEGMAR